jgi:hypothetical protein
MDNQIKSALIDGAIIIADGLLIYFSPFQSCVRAFDVIKCSMTVRYPCLHITQLQC